MARHPVIPLNELAKNAGEVYRATRRESPLACVLLSVSYLERLLVTVLSNFLINGPTSKRLFDPNIGGLGQFSSCSDVAYCLGLIAKDVHTNLRIVGKIRNTFAHSDVPMDFDNEKIEDFCKSLAPPIVLDESGNKTTFQIDTYGKTTRDRFSIVVTVLVPAIVCDSQSKVLHRLFILSCTLGRSAAWTGAPTAGKSPARRKWQRHALGCPHQSASTESKRFEKGTRLGVSSSNTG